MSAQDLQNLQQQQQQMDGNGLSIVPIGASQGAGTATLPTGAGSPLARFGVNSSAQAPRFNFQQLSGIMPFLQNSAAALSPQKAPIPALPPPPNPYANLQMLNSIAPNSAARLMWTSGGTPMFTNTSPMHR